MNETLEEIVSLIPGIPLPGVILLIIIVIIIIVVWLKFGTFCKWMD